MNDVTYIFSWVQIRDCPGQNSRNSFIFEEILLTNLVKCCRNIFCSDYCHCVVSRKKMTFVKFLTSYIALLVIFSVVATFWVITLQVKQYITASYVCMYAIIQFYFKISCPFSRFFCCSNIMSNDFASPTICNCFVCMYAIIQNYFKKFCQTRKKRYLT